MFFFNFTRNFRLTCCTISFIWCDSGKLTGQCPHQTDLNNKLNWIASQTYPDCIPEPSRSTDFTSISLPFVHPLHKNTSLVCKLSDLVHACHAVCPGSIPGRDKFPMWGFFRGFSSSVRQMSGSSKPTWFPEYILAIIVILLISALLKWMSEWMVCMVLNARIVSEVAPELHWSLIRGGPPFPRWSIYMWSRGG